MKVKIETEAAARLFGCEIGDVRDVQRQDVHALIDSKAVSVDETDEPPIRTKAKAKTKAGK
jgi:hypothetical protein